MKHVVRVSRVERLPNGDLDDVVTLYLATDSELQLVSELFPMVRESGLYQVLVLSADGLSH